MGEIKSTLDLVMERTRHLTLTDSEKDEQRRTEFHGRVEGAIQKYLDGALSLDQACRELESLRETFAQQERTPMLRAVLDRLDPDAAPGSLLDLIERLSGKTTEGLSAVFDAYEGEKSALAASLRSSLASDLAAGRRISGSAVKINLSASPEWNTGKERLRQQFSRRLEAEKKVYV